MSSADVSSRTNIQETVFKLFWYSNLDDLMVVC